MDTIRSTAVSATQTVSNTLDPSQNQGSNNQTSKSKKDAQGSSSDKLYKQQLDEAAYKNTPAAEETKKETLVEKAVSYIPGMSTMHKSQPEQSSDAQRKDGDISSETTPKRPKHDLQVEEFLKEQYKSKAGADMSNAGNGT